MRMPMHTFIALAVVLAACVTTDDIPVRTYEGKLSYGTVELTGWLDTRGELRLFSSRNAMEEDAEYPQCVSGVSQNHSSKKFVRFSKRHVRVRASVWDFDTLPNEADYELARKVLGNSIITNWCRGPKVLLIENVEAIR
jgi:hypothetical protein